MIRTETFNDPSHNPGNWQADSRASDQGRNP